MWVRSESSRKNMERISKRNSSRNCTRGSSGMFFFWQVCIYFLLILFLFPIRCFKLFGKRNNLLVRLYQFNSVSFQFVKQGKCFLFRKIGMEFFHRLVIQYAYAPEL